jgi:hypothetical protein
MYLTIHDFNNFISNNGVIPLSDEIQSLLLSLEKSLNVESIELSISKFQQAKAQSVNSKNVCDNKWNKTDNKQNKSTDFYNSFDKNKKNGKEEGTNIQKNSKYGLNSEPIITNLEEKWVKHAETIGDFKITKLEIKEGIEKTINDVRINLNKLTKKNYQTQKEKIYELIENVIQLSNVDKSMEMEPANNEIDTNLQRIAQFIFDISSSNKFFCELYANLYKDLIEKYNDIFINTLNTFILNYKESIQVFAFCDPNDDYEKYCTFVKESDKKKATTTFIIMLLNSGVILPSVVIEIADFFQNIIKQYINEENRTNEIEELGEIVYILISLGNNKIRESNIQKCDDIIHNICEFTRLKIKEHKSLSSRFIFKMKDLYDLL